MEAKSAKRRWVVDEVVVKKDDEENRPIVVAVNPAL